MRRRRRRRNIKRDEEEAEERRSIKRGKDEFGCLQRGFYVIGSPRDQGGCPY